MIKNKNNPSNNEKEGHYSSNNLKELDPNIIHELSSQVRKKVVEEIKLFEKIDSNKCFKKRKREEKKEREIHLIPKFCNQTTELSNAKKRMLRKRKFEKEKEKIVISLLEDDDSNHENKWKEDIQNLKLILVNEVSQEENLNREKQINQKIIKIDMLSDPEELEKKCDEQKEGLERISQTRAENDQAEKKFEEEINYSQLAQNQQNFFEETSKQELMIERDVEEKHFQPNFEEEKSREENIKNSPLSKKDFQQKLKRRMSDQEFDEISVDFQFFKEKEFIEEITEHIKKLVFKKYLEDANSFLERLKDYSCKQKKEYHSVFNKILKNSQKFVFDQYEGYFEIDPILDFN